MSCKRFYVSIMKAVCLIRNEHLQAIDTFMVYLAPRKEGIELKLR